MKKITLFALFVFTTITVQGQNKLLSSIDEYYTGSSWYPSNAYNYEYDSNNNLITETQFNYDSSTSSWVNSSKTTYVYNSNNKVTLMTNQNWNEVTNKFENSFRESSTYTNGKYVGSLGEEWDGLNWVNEWKNEITYKNNLIDSALFYNWENSQWVVESRETLTYNGNNKISEDLSETWLNSQWVNSDKSTLTYDVNNKIIMYKSSEWDGNASLFVETDKTDYFLDATGNRTSENYAYKIDQDLSKQEYTYDTSSLMSSFAHPFKDKNGVDYLFEDFPYVNKVLGSTYFQYDPESSTYINTGKTTYNYNSIILATEKFETATATITVFPNPTQDFISIQTPMNTEIERVIVTDISGKIILQQNKNIAQVNVQNLVKGIYFLQVFSGDKEWKTKFMKE